MGLELGKRGRFRPPKFLKLLHFISRPIAGFGLFAFGLMGPLCPALGQEIFQFQTDQLPTALVTNGQPESFELKKFSSGIWDLSVKGRAERLTQIALSEYSNSRMKFSTGQIVRDRNSVSEWIQVFDPRIIFSTKGGLFSKPKSRLTYPANDQKYLASFVTAWNEYRFRFLEELKALQAKFSQSNYATTFEVYGSKELLLDGISATLNDLEFQKKMKAVIQSAAEEIKKPKTLELNQIFYTPFEGKELKTKVIGSLSNVPVFDSSKVGFQLTPFSESSSATFDQSDSYFRDIEFQLPLEALLISISKLHVQSEFAPKPFQIDESDQVRVRVSLDPSEPLRLTAAIVWDRSTNAPDFRLRPPQLQSSLKKAKLSIYYRGKLLDSSERTGIANFLNSKEFASFFYNTIHENDLIQSMVKKATAGIIQKIGESFKIEKTLVAVSSDEANAKAPVDILAFDPADPKTDPTTNRKIIARFNIAIRLKILAPEVNVDGDPESAKILSKAKVSFDDPLVHISNLQFFFRGRMLPMQDFGLDFNIISKIGKTTDVQLSPSLSLGDQLSFDLGNLTTNLENLGIDNLSLRFGGERIETDRFQLNLLTQNADFFRRHIVSEPPRAQPTLGIGLQTAIVQQIRTEFADRLATITIPATTISVDVPITAWKTKIQAGIQGKSGAFSLPNLQLQEANLLFRDQSDNQPKCEGTYLISAHTYLGITDPMIIRGENLAFQLSALEKTVDLGKTANLSIGDVTAVVRQKPEIGKTTHAELSFDYDICLKPNQQDLDLNLRGLSHNLERIEFVEMQARHVKIDDKYLNKLSKILGWGDKESFSRDEKVSRLVRDILRSQQTLLATFIEKEMRKVFEERVPKYLKSPEVKTTLEQGFAKMQRLEDQVAAFTWNIGTVLKQPVESLLQTQLKAMVAEKMPEWNAWYQKERSVFREAFENIGEWVSQDVESRIASKLTDLTRGPSSLQAILKAFELELKPLASVQRLKGSLGFGTDTPRENLLKEVQVSQQLMRFAEVLDECPFVNSEVSKQKFSAYLQTISTLTERNKINLLQIVEDRCVQAKESLSEQKTLQALFKKGVTNLNQVLLSESTDKFLTVPSSKMLPLASGPKDWPTSLKENAGPSKPFRAQVQLHRWEMLPRTSTHGDLFKIVFLEPQLASLNLDDRIDPRILAYANARNIVGRIPQATINMALNLIDWAAAAAQASEKVKIFVHKSPALNSQNQVDFQISAKAFLIAGAELEGYLSFGLRVIPTEDRKSSRLEIVVDPLQIQKLSANLIGIEIGLLNKVVMHFIRLATDSLNKSLADQLQKLGDLPTFSKYSNQISLENILFQRGDVFIIGRRSNTDS